MELWGPIIKNKGVRYRKFRKVFARKANGGELIRTITGDGIETENTASKGDFIVKNQTGAEEEYILKAHKFKEKYKFLRRLKAGQAEYEAKGVVIALELDKQLFGLVNRKKFFRFIAPWGAPMIVRVNDFIVCPNDFSEIYRIARKEFFETYKEER